MGGRERNSCSWPAPCARAAGPIADGLVMRTNDAGALLVLEKRVLQHLLADEAASPASASGQG